MIKDKIKLFAWNLVISKALEIDLDLLLFISKFSIYYSPLFFYIS